MVIFQCTGFGSGLNAVRARPAEHGETVGFRLQPEC